MASGSTTVLDQVLDNDVGLSRDAGTQPARANAMQSFQMKTFMQMFSNTLCGANNGLGYGLQCKPLRSFITNKHFKPQQHSLTH